MYYSQNILCKEVICVGPGCYTCMYVLYILYVYTVCIWWWHSESKYLLKVTLNFMCWSANCWRNNLIKVTVSSNLKGGINLQTRRHLKVHFHCLKIRGWTVQFACFKIIWKWPSKCWESVCNKYRMWNVRMIMGNGSFLSGTRSSITSVFTKNCTICQILTVSYL